MLFGLLCSKFRILQQPLQVDLNGEGKLFLCCARLHRFVINKRMETNGNFDMLNDLAVLSCFYLQ
jgi:hypothetical protein